MNGVRMSARVSDDLLGEIPETMVFEEEDEFSLELHSVKGVSWGGEFDGGGERGRRGTQYGDW